MARWTFTDTVDTYVFPVNPSASEAPSLRKRIHRATPTNPPVGFAIRMEGRADVPNGRLSGTVRDQRHYQKLIDWWLNKPVITVTDDLGSTFSIVPTGLTLTPASRRHLPWRATYSFEYQLVNPAVI